MKNILFISTNSMWSGSEELWSRSAKGLISEGFKISYATKYDHLELNKIKARKLKFSNRFRSKSIIKRGIERITKLSFSLRDELKEFILDENPQLVIISQGNNYESLDIMLMCYDLKIPFITLTQLVADLFIWVSKNEYILEFQRAYLSAKKNFFVSQNNLRLNNFFLGCDLPNAEIVYNPCKLLANEIPDYSENDNIFNIGLVGRIECWHKGYDLFIQVVNQIKWKERPVFFNIYGDGPHSEFIKICIARFNLNKVVLKGFSDRVDKIWKENQILFMPSRLEGQALALIEAMWCHRAAIVTDVGGAVELVEEGISGFIAKNATVESIDAALERAWENRLQWKQMGLNAANSLKTKYPSDSVEYFNRKIKSILKE